MNPELKEIAVRDIKEPMYAAISFKGIWQQDGVAEGIRYLPDLLKAHDSEYKMQVEHALEEFLEAMRPIFTSRFEDMLEKVEDEKEFLNILKAIGIDVSKLDDKKYQIVWESDKSVSINEIVYLAKSPDAIFG